MAGYNDNFEYDSEGYVQAYTDGACQNNGRSGASAGQGIYWGEGNSMNKSRPHWGRQTNNSSEIRAAEKAVWDAKFMGETKVAINTDSKFLARGASEWTPKWESNNWHKSDGGEVKNKSDFQALQRASQGMDVKYNHVPGHSGNRGNSAADSLAKQGARSNNRY